MMPALDWLKVNAATLGEPTPAFFYWASGTLSSVLDNAPTYLSFLNAIFGAFVDPGIVNQVQHLVQTQGADLAAITGPQAEHIQNTFAALQRYHAADLLHKTVTEDEIEICFLLGNLAYNKYILAVSVGAVFFGANTYNGSTTISSGTRVPASMESIRGPIDAASFRTVTMRATGSATTRPDVFPRPRTERGSTDPSGST